MKRYLTMFVLVILCFLLQTTILPVMTIGSVHPNLILVLTAAAGFMYGRRCGMFVGVCFGVLVDFLYGSVIGTNIMIFTLIGYVNGALNKLYIKDDYALPLIAIATSDIAYGFLFFLLHFLLRGRLDVGYYLLHIIFPEMMCTILIGIPFYLFVHWIDRLLYPPVEVPLDINKDMAL